MNLDLSTIMKLLPYMPRIQKGMATIERIYADPDVQDLVALEKELMAILVPPPATS